MFHTFNGYSKSDETLPCHRVHWIFHVGLQTVIRVAEFLVCTHCVIPTRTGASVTFSRAFYCADMCISPYPVLAVWSILRT